MIDFKKKYCSGPWDVPPSEEHPHFSRSICEAHWIESPNEHESHPGESLVTRSHEVILRWAEERSAVPATIPGTEHNGHLGVLRFDFPDYEGQTLQHVTWEEWFKAFDERQLVMVFQEHMRNGRRSNFFKFNSPFREHE